MPNRASSPKGETSSPFAGRDERRHAIAELWVRNVPVRRIATMLKIPHRTVRSDLVVIKKEMADSRVTDIEARRDRTIAELRTVIAECWTRLSRIKDTSNNVTGMLNTIVNAEKLVAQLEGTLDTPSVSVTQTTNVVGMSTEEWQSVQQVIVTALEDHPDARSAVASALMEMSHAS